MDPVLGLLLWMAMFGSMAMAFALGCAAWDTVPKGRDPADVLAWLVLLVATGFLTWVACRISVVLMVVR